ncbi:MAG TPA: DUF2884 family protein [Luteimonas sp.]|nr:DUF2884 family protein [Luteimonas sp.]
MARMVATLGLLLASGVALAAPERGDGRIDINADCNVESDYTFHLTDRSVVFTREQGSPRTVLMRDGGLFVDGSWARLDAADSARVRDYEREARAAMPLAQQIGREAAEIAFTAIGEVAAGFSNDPAEARRTLAAARGKLDAHLARTITPTRFSSEALGDGIGEAVSEVLPSLIGDVVGGAVRAAMGGDTARLARMENLDSEIEAKIGPRAKALEAKADALCRRMESLDRIDNALAYRTAAGAPLGLLEITPRGPDASR